MQTVKISKGNFIDNHNAIKGVIKETVSQGITPQ